MENSESGEVTEDKEKVEKIPLEIKSKEATQDLLDKKAV
jgi:hypothetical protein